MASRTYRLAFTPHDDKSTDTLELLFEVRTEADGLGILLVDGHATDSNETTVIVLDEYLTPGIENSRFLRIYDGAGNPFDTSFVVEVQEQAIADVLEGSVIGVGFIFEWRDHRYNFLADLTPAVIQADVMLVNDRPVARTASFRIDPAEFPEGFNPDTERISIRGRFLREDLVQQYPLGLFALDVGQEEFHAAGEPIDILVDTDTPAEPTRFLDALGADVCSHLEEEVIEAPYTVEVGSNYVTEVETLIESVTFVDFTGQARPMRHQIPATAHVTPADFTWPPETSTLTVINDLLAGINFYKLYADGQAILRTRERVLPWVDNVGQVYTTMAEPRMIVSPFRRFKRRGQNPNQILATIDDPARAVLATTRQNDDASSVIGTPNAKPSLQTRQTPRIVDATVQEQFADFELAWASAMADRAGLSTAFDPRRDGREFYQLKIAGVEDDTRWLVFGWSLSMAVGALEIHDIGRADTLSFSDLTL